MKRIPRAMTIYQSVLAMVLAVYIGVSRLNHIPFVARDLMLTSRRDANAPPFLG